MRLSGPFWHNQACFPLLLDRYVRLRRLIWSSLVLTLGCSYDCPMILTCMKSVGPFSPPACSNSMIVL